MAAASIISSVVTGGSNSHQTVAEELNVIATDFMTQGIVAPSGFTPNTGSGGAGSFCVNADASPDMGVTIKAGQAYVSGTPSGQDAQVLRARMASDYTVYAINANASGSTKYDWIYLQLSAANANNPSAAGDNVITLVTSRSSSNTSDNGSPPTYGLLLAVVTVANGASSITNANIADKRIACVLASTSTSAINTGWNALSYALTYGANNGNKEFTVTTPYDLTGILTPGMRLKVSRSVTPPTQAMKFVKSSSQWANKTSPSGYTFTGAFTQEAWVFLTSYPSGSAGAIIGRRSGSVGANYLRVDSTGQLSILYGDGSGNFTQFQTYQSLPLNRWVHVAGAVTSVSSKTAVMYINGAIVPSATILSAATTLVQAGDLGVGGYTSGTETFDGYISEARVWSAAQSQANIQANMAISLVGSETNLVALFQGNGNFNDATSNANNLTANGGAIATQAANPYSATEYAIITKVSYSNPTTTITLFTGTDYTIPNQTLNTPYYATVKAPYGFPASKYKWLVDYKYKTSVSQIVTSTGAWLNIAGLQFSIPTGDFDVDCPISSAATASAAALVGNNFTLSTANNTESNDELSGQSTLVNVSSTQVNGSILLKGLLSNSAITTWFLNAQPTAVSGTTTAFLNASASVPCEFRFFNAYI